VNGTPTNIKTFEGSIVPSSSLRVGIYEQEIDSKYLPMPLGEAVEHVYNEAGLPMGHQQLSGVLASYLFDPTIDKDLQVRHLSGGQKARFQLIRMLCTNPNLLILDEPTNHLDLPSIEELEDALLQYHGAIIYVSHDSFFIDHIGGQVMQIGKA
jgi:ATPase subunit of ABC transporter with duplicated ATPase domains